MTSDELRRIKPDILLLAEAPASDPYYRASGFDAGYDWTAELGRWAWQDAFEDPRGPAPKLRDAIRASQAPQRAALRT